MLSMSAGYELGSFELEASTLTADHLVDHPPPYPKNIWLS